jgi:hypothetical protein
MLFREKMYKLDILAFLDKFIAIDYRHNLVNNIIFYKFQELKMIQHKQTK